MPSTRSPGTIEPFTRTATTAIRRGHHDHAARLGHCVRAGRRAPPWVIGRPQPAFVRLADRGLLSGRLLNAGCGTGEHTLLAAARGAEAMGVDISPHAIARARDKAAGRDLPARFEVADVLNLGQLGMTFDVVPDGSKPFSTSVSGVPDDLIVSVTAVTHVRLHTWRDGKIRPRDGN